VTITGLGQVVDIVMGQAPPGDACNKDGIGVPFVKAGEFQDRRPVIREWTTKPLKLAKHDDTLVCVVGATAGKVNQGADCAIGRSVAAVRPHPSEIDPAYLYRFLSTTVTRLRGGSQGAAQGVITREMIGNLDLVLPPLPEQRRIAAILDHADAVLAKRRQVLTHLDALTQTIFFDMFGDIKASRWERVPFGELVPKVENGTSPNCESRPAREDEWAVLKLGAVTYGVFQPGENKAYLDDLGSMAKNEVKSGDILMTRKNTRELVGAVALVNGEVRPRLLLPDLIFRLHLDQGRMDRRYFQALMMNPQKRPSVRDLSSGSAASMPNISKGRLASLPIELPPLELQADFAARIERVEALRSGVQSLSRVDDALFVSLQARAFLGDL
jgi:type I restriction enzyme S subunit